MGDRSYSDCPISNKDEDILGIQPSALALADFIMEAQTPLTISVQGSWGSGKTSFMNIIQSILDGASGFKTVNIQTWDFYLYTDDRVGTQAVIGSILKALEQETKAKDKFAKGAKSAQNLMAKGLGMLASVQGGDGDTVLRTLSDEPNTTERLRDLVKSIVKRSPETTFVFFVDDLDRIEPKTAVGVLDILRSIFFIEQCVFLIAIDADVVARGLSQKYSTSSLDPHISRDYFDKLFQMTYYIPTNKEASIDYLWRGLRDTGLFNTSDDKRIVDKGLKAATVLLKHNPRKIKRLIIQMEYRKAFDAYNNNYLMNGSVYLRAMAVLLAALEIESPNLIRHLCLYPDFTHPTSRSMATLIDGRSLQDIPETSRWDEWYKEVLLQSNYADDTVGILLALRTLDELLEDGERINLKTVLGISNYVDYSNGDVSITDTDFEESVETSYTYGMRLFGEMNIGQGAHIIHLGCQDGRVTREILAQSEAGFVLAIEMQEALAQAAQTTLENSGINHTRYEVVYRQIEDVNDRETYDFAFSTTAAHWIRKPVYDKAFQALKHGGFLFFEQSGHGTYEAMHEVLERAIRENVSGDRGDISAINPFYMPTLEELQTFLAGLGFVDIKIRSEVDSGDDYGSLYDDYISTNALPYMKDLTSEERGVVRERFLELCRQEHTAKDANIFWITAKKPDFESSGR